MPAPARKLRVATTSLAGCFGCHMSLLDIDEKLFDLLEIVTLDRTPLTDTKVLGECDIGLVEGGLCNAENVHVLREFRHRCRVLVAVGACAVNGGLPAQRNHLPLALVLGEVYGSRPGLVNGAIPDDPELPLPLDRVHALHEVVRIDHFIPGCPPPAEALLATLLALAEGRDPRLAPALIHFD